MKKLSKRSSEILRSFLEKVVVIDTESTGLDPRVAEICELGTTRFKYDLKTGKFKTNTDSILIGTQSPIPFAASSKNNISRKMLEGVDKFDVQSKKVVQLLGLGKADYLVAHNHRYDKMLLTSSFERSETVNVSAFKNSAGKDMPWVCTMKLAKHFYEPSKEEVDLSYSLNYLRYALDLDMSDSAAIHRAGDDSLSCAKLLEHFAIAILHKLEEAEQLEEGFDLGEFFKEVTLEPVKLDKMNFGKYKGQPIENVPLDYFEWLIKNHDSLKENDINYDFDLAHTIEVEYDRRSRKLIDR